MQLDCHRGKNLEVVADGRLLEPVARCVQQALVDQQPNNANSEQPTTGQQIVAHIMRRCLLLACLLAQYSRCVDMPQDCRGGWWLGIAVVIQGLWATSLLGLMMAIYTKETYLETLLLYHSHSSSKQFRNLSC